MRFADRTDAGRRLAEHLATLSGIADRTPVVVGMARGGVVVAAAVAERLGAPLDVIVVRKLGCPWQPELGVGALAEGGITVIDQELVTELGIGAESLAAVVERERRELARRVERYRGRRPPIALDGRTVVLVDDGIATGGTARAAVASLRARGASRVIVAVPVGPPDAAARLAGLTDAVVVLDRPRWFAAIGEAYRTFDQVSDDAVVTTLDEAAAVMQGGR